MTPELPGTDMHKIILCTTYYLMSPNLPRGDMYKIKICTKKLSWAKRNSPEELLKEKLRCASIHKFDNLFVDRQLLFQTSSEINGKSFG